MMLILKGKEKIMRKMIFGLMVAFYLGGLVGCAEWAAGDRQAGRDNFPAGGSGHQHMMPTKHGNNQLNEQGN